MKSFDDIVESNEKIIEMIGDCPNVETKVNPDDPLWKTVKSNSKLSVRQV